MMFLRQVASRLTQLRLRDPEISESLAEVGLCRLETLQLPLLLCRQATIGRLLDANTSTLRSVVLTGYCSTPEAAQSSISKLLAPLNGLPHLTDLTTLCFDVDHISLVSTVLELVCPRLEELALPERTGHGHDCVFLDENQPRSRPDIDPSLGGLVLECPQLRSIEGFTCTLGQFQAMVMPHLTWVRGIRNRFELRSPFLPQLLDVAPRLRNLSSVDAKEPALLGRLLASGSLVRLCLRVDADILPGHSARSGKGRTLGLPAQLEQLRVVVVHPDDVELVVDGPGLRSLSLVTDSESPGPRVALRCPALVALQFIAPKLVSLGLADPRDPIPPLVNLALVVRPHPWDGNVVLDDPYMEDAAGPMELLGARLRRPGPQTADPDGVQLPLGGFRLPELCSGGSGLPNVERFEPAGGRVPPNLHVDARLVERLSEWCPWLNHVPDAGPPYYL
ncbi:hypothetical protein PAPYR_4752 [Paratrimastix pyriformis]|uniref:Uncharacterized protein n=1 Tax=Paratrimastix pyriformis TaxID=342808 RepID=A0ABQ8UMK0_9EUKA|nr:hypothetical protein PAPYR_4752 [Paratrimastix pyriformis]